MRLGGDGQLLPPGPNGGNPGGPGRPQGDDGIEVFRGVKLSPFSLTGIAAAGIGLYLLIASIGNIEITEYGLNSSLITRKVSQKPYTSGRYWIGPFNHFITFPAVLKTIQFSDSALQGDLGMDELGDPMLRSRTKDGLDVSIELSFQYQLNPDTLFDLYTELGAGWEFHKTYVRVAIDLLTEVATDYTANEFFVDRTVIGKAMEEQLKAIFEKKLYATIFSFQLRSVVLPKEFEDAIQITEVRKQDVEVAQAEQNSARVSLETDLMKAERAVKVRNNVAQGVADSLMLANDADIGQFKATQTKTADSYGQVLGSLDNKEGDLLAYVQARVLRNHPSEKMTIGMSLPSLSTDV